MPSNCNNIDEGVCKVELSWVGRRRQKKKYIEKEMEKKKSGYKYKLRSEWVT